MPTNRSKTCAPSRFRKYLDEVADDFLVDPESVVARSKAIRPCRARQWLSIKLRDEHYSLPAIADRLGQDHTTVLHSTKHAPFFRTLSMAERDLLIEIEEPIWRKMVHSRAELLAIRSTPLGRLLYRGLVSADVPSGDEHLPRFPRRVTFRLTEPGRMVRARELEGASQHG